MGFLRKSKEKKTIGSGKVITVINQKGGVGKTTMAFNIAHALSHSGKKVLAIDLDPQMNLSLLFDGEKLEYNVFHLLLNSVRELKSLHQPVMFADLIQTKEVGKRNIDFICSGQELSGLELTVAGITAARQLILKKFIEINDLRSLYDYIILDSPPTLGLIMVNILCAGDGVLVPFKPDQFSQIGLEHLYEVIDNIEDMGVTQIPEVITHIPNLMDARRKQDHMELEKIRNTLQAEFGKPLVSDVFYNRAYFAKSHSAKKSVFDYKAKEFEEVKGLYMNLATTIKEWADGQAQRQ